jgi:hypothetical protein
MSNEISNKVKILATGLLCAGSYGTYKFYQKYNTPKLVKPMTDEQLVEKLKKSAEQYPNSNTEYKGIYLYSKTSNKIYLRGKDGKVYNAGNVSDCQYILDEKNPTPAYAIEDIYETYNCSNIPSQYQTQCSGSATGSVSVRISTAEEFEKNLEKSVVGDTVISKDSCFPPEQIDGGDSLGTLGKTYSKIEEFYRENIDLFVDMAKQFGIFIAVANIHIMFAVAVFVLPGVFSSNEWEATKSGYTTLQILGEWILGHVVEISKMAIEAAKPGMKSLINAADGSIMKVSSKLAMKISNGVSVKVLTVFTKVMSSAVMFFDVLGYIQIALMIVDTFDFCKIMTLQNNLNQNILDMEKKMSDNFFIQGVGYKILYPNIWNPSQNYCDYDLDPRYCSLKFSECKSQIFRNGQKWGDNIKNLRTNQTDKNQITQEQYCSDISKKYQEYQIEYIDKLKTNSFGQCLTQISNKEIAQTLKLYAGDRLPGVDFDSIIGINKNNYPDDLFPKSDFAKQFSIFLVNQNSFAAQFVKDNIYYFLSVFIVILIIILFV